MGSEAICKVFSRSNAPGAPWILPPRSRAPGAGRLPRARKLDPGRHPLKTRVTRVFWRPRVCGGHRRRHRVRRAVAIWRTVGVCRGVQPAAGHSMHPPAVLVATSGPGVPIPGRHRQRRVPPALRERRAPDRRGHAIARAGQRAGVRSPHPILEARHRLLVRPRRRGARRMPRQPLRLAGRRRRRLVRSLADDPADFSAVITAGATRPARRERAR